MTGRRSLPKYARLRRSSEIRAMFRSGRRRSCGSVDLFVIQTGDQRTSRFGVVVPKHGHTIVERNRIERRIREFLRTEWLPRERAGDATHDVLVRARPPAYETTASDLAESLRQCLELTAS